MKRFVSIWSSIWCFTIGTFPGVSGCSGGVVLQPPDGMAIPGKSKRSRQQNANESTFGDDDSSVSTGKANFKQVAGKFYHPEHNAKIFGGALAVDVGVDVIKLVTSGLDTDSDQKQVKQEIRGGAGTASFERVLSRQLPSEAKFRDHPYLIFARSVTNKKGTKFTISDGQAFPIYASADGDAGTYANLSRSPVSFSVNFLNPQPFTATFTVSRATSSQLTSNGVTCSQDSSTISSALANQKSHYGIKIEVSGIPDGMLGDFPVPSSVYVIQLANGGMISHVGSCSGFYDSKRTKRGYTAMEFAK